MERAEQEEGSGDVAENASAQTGWPGEEGREGSMAEVEGGSRVALDPSLGW